MTTVNLSDEEFIVPEMDHTIGNLICSYLSSDPQVFATGYRIDHNNNLIIRVKTTGETSPGVCMSDAIKRCQEDINHISSLWD